MFSKQWKARIEGAGIAITRINREEKKRTTVNLVYPFDDKCAGAIGGAAPAAQDLLSQSGDSPCKTKSLKLVLDSNDVKMVISAGKDDNLTVSHTSGLVASCKRPTKEGGTEPVLSVKVAWHNDDDSEADLALQFLHRHLGDVLNVRMDRRQLELIEGEGGEE